MHNAVDSMTIFMYYIKVSGSHGLDALWPLGQVVKTSPFHGGNMGSNPVGVTIWPSSSAG